MAPTPWGRPGVAYTGFAKCGLWPRPRPLPRGSVQQQSECGLEGPGDADWRLGVMESDIAGGGHWWPQLKELLEGFLSIADGPMLRLLQGVYTSPSLLSPVPTRLPSVPPAPARAGPPNFSRSSSSFLMRSELCVAWSEISCTRCVHPDMSECREHSRELMRFTTATTAASTHPRSPVHSSVSFVSRSAIFVVISDLTSCSHVLIMRSKFSTSTPSSPLSPVSMAPAGLSQAPSFAPLCSAPSRESPEPACPCRLCSSAPCSLCRSSSIL
mmetsp:Transcript_64656/g.181923  ORF Transcript_64656/g.181923 Transcript_64656/m.181923 type:complete len:270 (+) Transcript_64656:268-1077(+)